jgi:myxalamid-type polyketide synthase MxaB
VLLEIGAQPILLGLAMGNLSDTAQAHFCPSLRRTEEDWVSVLTTLSKLYVAGVEMEWGRWFGVRPKNLQLPTYPFQRTKFWFVAEEEGASGGTGLGTPLLHPLLGRQFPSPLSELTFCQTFRLKDLPYINDHRVAERIVVSRPSSSGALTHYPLLGSL